MWRYTDLTQVTGSPLAEGEPLAAYAWEAGRSRQVVYSSGDGHIHELMLEVGGTWSHTDLTDFAAAPLADGSSLVGFAWEGGGTKQVIYTNNNGNIYELVAAPHNMLTHADLTSFTRSHRRAACCGNALPGLFKRAPRGDGYKCYRACLSPNSTRTAATRAGWVY